MDTTTKIFDIKNLAELSRLTSRLAGELRGNETLGLTGELGAGKTQFVKSLAEALGVSKPVLSPTFVLERLYLASRFSAPIHHIDAYRIADADLIGMGASDWLGEELGLVEWADRVQASLPADTVWIEMTRINNESRRIKITCPVSRQYLCR